MPVCYLKQKHMINKQLITRRFSRAVESYNREAVAQKQIAYRMSAKSLFAPSVRPDIGNW